MLIALFPCGPAEAEKMQPSGNLKQLWHGTIHANRSDVDGVSRSKRLKSMRLGRRDGPLGHQKALSHRAESDPPRRDPAQCSDSARARCCTDAADMRRIRLRHRTHEAQQREASSASRGQAAGPGYVWFAASRRAPGGQARPAHNRQGPAVCAPPPASANLVAALARETERFQRPGDFLGEMAQLLGDRRNQLGARGMRFLSSAWRAVGLPLSGSPGASTGIMSCAADRPGWPRRSPTCRWGSASA